MPKPSKLSQTIQRLLTEAQLNPGKNCTRTLAHGLHLHIRSVGASYKVSLSRSEAAPSETELNTVIKYWPEQTPPPEIERAYLTFIIEKGTAKP